MRALFASYDVHVHSVNAAVDIENGLLFFPFSLCIAFVLLMIAIKYVFNHTHLRYASYVRTQNKVHGNLNKTD